MCNQVFKTFSKVSIGLLLLFILQLSACKEEAPLRLTSRQRDQVDTMYAERVKLLASEMDSLCNQMFTLHLDAIVDSLIKVRRQQENSLREKYRK